jgi:glucose-6-phosphate 1-epimerase
MPATALTADDAPHLILRAADGAMARIHLDGAHVSAWVPAGSSDDRLFVSARSRYGAGTAIRGGIPVIFPQFGTTGPLRQHGFARLMPWTVAAEWSDGDGAHARLTLTDTHETRALWPNMFSAEIAVTVGADTLSVALTVTNTGAQQFEFSAALHPYFRVHDAFACTVHGLHGTRYRDSLRDGAEFDETHEALAITGPIDRVYIATPDTITVREGSRVLRIEKSGFPDTVVWNPGAEGSASRPDFAPGEQHVMLCVEAAAVRPMLSLAPGAQWTGRQVMIAAS